MFPRTQAIIFSKDRAFQVEATLASFFARCQDAKLCDTAVLYKSSSALHARQYEKLKAAYPTVTFIPEQNFKDQLLRWLNSQYLLFLVDDNIFVRDFWLADIASAMESAPAAIGFSLRLGKNTTYCYAMNQPQPAPAFEVFKASTRPVVMRYRWFQTPLDFGYAMEVSSSVYRTPEIFPLLQALPFAHPNSLESVLAQQNSQIAPQRPEMLCYETSVTFCNPINKVQVIAPDNRAGESVCHSADDLARVFDEGGRLDFESYRGFTPNACHQEVALKIRHPEAKTSIVTLDTAIEQPLTPRVGSATPLISVVIPCYKQARFLPEAVSSLLAQTYQNWECVIVNDGSPDDTSAVANALIAQNPARQIRLVEKDNEGLAEARNTGIRESSGEWILPLDSDDRFEPTIMEKLLAVALSDSRVNVVSPYVRCFGAKSEIIPIRRYSQAEIMRDNVFPYASLYKRDLWEKYGGYKPIIPFGAEDYNFWVTCSEELNPRTVAEPLFLYRKHEGASMVDAVISHRAEVDACLHTCHPGLYPAHILLQEHEVLAAMHDETRAVVDKHIARFPQYSQLYLWRGLHNEQRGHWRQALRDFSVAAKLAAANDWQPWFRLALLNAERNDLESASTAARITIERSPKIPMREQLEFLVSAGQRP